MAQDALAAFFLTERAVGTLGATAFGTYHKPTSSTLLAFSKNGKRMRANATNTGKNALMFAIFPWGGKMWHLHTMQTHHFT